MSALGQENPNTERGFSPGKSYHFDGIDAINIFNGNLNITLPIGQTYPVGGKLSYGLTLSYGGNSWLHGIRYWSEQTDEGLIEHTASYEYPSWKANAGFAWVFSLGGRLIADPSIAYPSYESSDGGVHTFYPTLHSGETFVSDIWYTRDGTYLRYNKTTRVLESPDGLRRDFDSVGRLTKIYDRFSNWVSVAYNDVSNPIASGSTTWHIWDSQGRHHYVYFKPTAAYFEEFTSPTVQHESVAAVDLATFNGGSERYTFTYDAEGTVSNPGPWTTLVRPGCCPGGEVASTTLATLLTSVRSTSTDGSGTPLRYSFTYKTDDALDDLGDPGTLTSMALPTGGTIEYRYTNFGVPPPPVFSQTWKDAPSVPDLPVSVTKRTVKDAAGHVLGCRTYVDNYGTTGESVSRTVTEFDPSADKTGCGAILQKSRHYFSICPKAPCTTATAFAAEYGLPVTRDAGYDGLQLSVEQYGGANWDQVKRSQYLKYENDSFSATGNLDQNRRVVAEGTLYADDGNRWAKTVSSDFDGYGHYRQADTAGTFEGSNVRTTVTKFNPSRGTYGVSGFVSWPVSTPWILETFTYQTVTAAEAPPGQTGTSRTAMTISCFDANTGFLQRRRQLKADVGDPASPTLGATDLLAVFTADSAGNVVKEQYLGGDAPPTVSTLDQCGGTISAEAYRIDHTWTYGTVSVSQYYDGVGNGNPLTFRTVDNTIDANTGLVSASRSRAVGTAGMTTNYQYDFLGRLLTVRSDTALGALAEGGTAYSYTFNPPSVDVYQETAGTTPSRFVQQPDGSTTYLPHVHYDLDVLGRVTRESRDMPSGTPMSHTTSYNALGSKTAVSEWESIPSHFTFFTYDEFGRPLKITAPDGSVVDQSYSGVSSMSRTVKVRTGTTAANLASTQTSATTTETYDRYQRLRKIVEPGENTQTLYTYDVGGRLANVCSNYSSLICGQSRTFNYDNRGFLTSETHPEKGATGNGTTSYEYDARGHMTRRYEGAGGDKFDLTYTYDRAERTKTVAETIFRQNSTFNRILKKYEYGTDNGTNDFRNGQLTRATRFNWFDSRDTNVQISEQYVYGGVGGRPSSRTTSEYECAISSGATCNDVAPNVAKRSFAQTFSYDPQGDIWQLGYPSCAGDCSFAGINVSSSYSRGLLTDVQFPYNAQTRSNTLSYAENGALFQLAHANGVVDTQQHDPNMMQRPLSLSSTGATDASTCAAPTITANPISQSVATNAVVTLTAAATGESSAGHVLQYQWYRGTAGDTTSPITGETNNQYQFTASTTSAGSYWMRASNNCGANGAAATADTTTATVALCTAPDISIQPGSVSTTRGVSRRLSVTATGGTLQYQWYIGAVPINGATFSSIDVTPTNTTTYWVAVSNACGTTNSQSATVTVYGPPTPPTFLTVSSSSGGPVQLSWSGATAPAGFDHYQIQRIEAGRPGYNDYVTTSLASNTDSSVNHWPNPYYAYAYRIVTVDVNGVRSAPSVADAAMVGTFADDPLPAVALIRGIHFSQLRQAIDAMRATAGLPAIWSSYAPLTGVVRAGAMEQMRSALDEARNVLGLSQIVYHWPSPLSGRLIHRYDIDDLRTGVK
ncbi:MAG TPA: hypothetical protein VJZ76_07115 [Thermoanaerobaculia bacterium]|nr:hypothetical protein [Thermoanaerobaculia bacterium]